MRKEPISQLTSEDRTAIAEYIKAATRMRPSDIDQMLTTWNKNKRTLFKVLGQQLRITVPIEMEKNHNVVVKELQDIYCAYNLFNRQEYMQYASRRLTVIHTHGFVHKFFMFLLDLHDNGLILTDNLYDISSLFSYRNVCKGYLIDHMGGRIIYHDGFCSQKTYEIKHGAKTMKTIGKIVKLLEFPNLDLFEKWRNQISDITTTQRIKSNLVISIHPLDFLTLSDNNCDWHSCYSLLRDGMHAEAASSHMNSNMVAVAYLESSKEFIVNNCRIPNKSWRQMIYIHKNIICGGRSYPNENEELSQKIIDIVREMVYNNIKWKYQYGVQNYNDMWSYGDNENARKYRDREWLSYKHSLVLYLGDRAGYNDFIECSDEQFYCVRNWVPKTKYLCVTGPVTCLHCGKPIPRHGYFPPHKTLCPDCVSKREKEIEE